MPLNRRIFGIFPKAGFSKQCYVRIYFSLWQALKKFYPTIIDKSGNTRYIKNMETQTEDKTNKGIKQFLALF